jgi:hypothetical protein
MTREGTDVEITAQHDEDVMVALGALKAQEINLEG